MAALDESDVKPFEDTAKFRARACWALATFNLIKQNLSATVPEEELNGVAAQLTIAALSAT